LSIAELERKGLVRRFEPSADEIRALLQIAERDVSVAKVLLGSDLDWAFNVAYNAMLQTARAWMLKQKFRPVGESHHEVIIDFARTTLGKGFEEVDVLDIMRKKRHRAVYGEIGVISKTEAENALKSAESFLKKVSKKVSP